MAGKNIQPEAPPPQLTGGQKNELIQRTIDRIGQDSIATTNRAVLTQKCCKLQEVTICKKRNGFREERVNKSPHTSWTLTTI